jgi:hypothetical protein
VRRVGVLMNGTGRRVNLGEQLTLVALLHASCMSALGGGALIQIKDQ